MHIAVLDDNIADRKQLERLLDRESDRRINTTGNLYTDSFGSTDALFTAPKQYDFFMIDLKGPVTESMEIAERLRSIEVWAPVCIMRNESESSLFDSVPENIFWLEKPIKVKELTDLIESVIELNSVLSEKMKEERLLKESQTEVRKEGLIKSILHKIY